METLRRQMLVGRPGRQIVGLLRRFGLDYAVPNEKAADRLYHVHVHGVRLNRHGSFWVREEERLPFILYEAKERYRELAKAIRPDRTENHKEAVDLILTWKRIERLFALHGVTL